MNQPTTQHTNTTERTEPRAADSTPEQGTQTGGAAGGNGSMSHRLADKFMHGKGIFTFLRSSVSSQIASWTDMGIAFVFFAWVLRPLGGDPLRQFFATAIGLVVGGVVNCCINYKFTFRAENCPVKAVAVKYLLIWGGSFVLNLTGTTVLTHMLQSIDYLHSIGIKDDGIFAFSRLTVSLAVSLAWNFLLQKNFVYVPTKFDPYAIRAVDFVTFHNSRHHGDSNHTNQSNSSSKTSPATD